MHGGGSVYVCRSYRVLCMQACRRYGILYMDALRCIVYAGLTVYVQALRYIVYGDGRVYCVCRWHRDGISMHAFEA